MTDIIKQYNQLQRAYEAQAEENADLALLADQYKAERDALAAELAGLKKQEPVAHIQTHKGGDIELVWDKDEELEGALYEYAPLFAAPKALAPLTDDQIVDLAKIDCGIDFGTDDIAEDQAIESVIALVRAAEKHHGIEGTP